MGFTKILLPVDGSPEDRAAIEKSSDLAKAVGGEITAVYVRGNDEFGTEGFGALLFADSCCRSKGVSINSRVYNGFASEVLVGISKEFDVMFLSTLGRGGIRKAIMGSVAEVVLRNAKCPVITIRPIPESIKGDFPAVIEYRNILFATEGNGKDLAAAEKSIELASITGGKVTALYVGDGDPSGIDAYAKVAADRGVPFEKVVMQGDPGEVVCDESAKYDIVAVGRNPRGLGKKKTKVSDAVIGGALRPVLVVRNRR